MKITCPKCLSVYRVDLPDVSEAGIDVQCGKCLHIFQFSPDIEKPGPSEKPSGISAKIRDSDLPEVHSSKPILPPQKDGDQEVSGSKQQPPQSKKRVPSSPEKNRETLEELKPEPLSDNLEPIEIVIEDETPVDSLEKDALEDIWDQAMREGARTTGKSKEKPSTPPSEKPIAETITEKTLEETPPLPDKKSKRPPALEDKQQEFELIIEDHQAKPGENEKNLPVEESQPPLPRKDSQQEKTQEEIDLEEQVTIDKKEVNLSWEEAFSHQAEVEAGWNKAKEQNRIQEEQQLAEALGEEYIPLEPAISEPPADAENPQTIADDIFTQMDSQSESTDQPPIQETPASLTADTVTPTEEEYEPTWTDAFADQSEIEETWKKPEEQEGFSEITATSEKKEAAPSDPTSADDIDLKANLAGMDMKQLVERAFKEESEQTTEAPVSEEVETPALEEVAPEPEPALEMEASLETPVAEQAIPVSRDEEEYEPTWTDAFADQSEIEDTRKKPEEAEEEPAPEPEETIAQEQEPEIELEPEMEPSLESAEIPAETETTITESLEIEPEPELTTESHETAGSSEEQPSVSQEPSLDEEGQELWADLLPEHKEEKQPVHEEAPTAFSGEEEEGSFGESDFWDQVLEKGTQESQTAETAAQQQPVSPAPMAQDTAHHEALTDEELWQQAFPGEGELEPATSKHFGEAEENSQSNIPPLVIGTDVKPNEESENSSEYNEAAYADYEDDDEFEFERKKRRLGPFTIPHGRRGDLVIGGTLVVFLLLAGSVYFTLQTFAPGELTDVETAKTEIPEGLTPREVPLDELAGLTSKPEKTPPVADTPGDKGEAILSDPSKILEASPEEKGILKDLAESQILKDTGKSQTAKIGPSALQALAGRSVTLSTIMPVAYNPTDIRVLSFSVEMQLSDVQSAKRVRESLPVYEEIMNQTVENFLRRKFYNDILYVKEKLQKRLQTAMNRSLKNGRVKKAKFTDFAIQ